MRMRWRRLAMLAVLWCPWQAHAQSEPAASVRSGKKAGLVFSVKTWDGEYSSKDLPGGVVSTPVVGAIYTIGADGSGLKKIVQLGNNTEFPCVSPDGKWVYFKSNASGHSQLYRCRLNGT